MLGYGESDGARQLVAIALQVVIEGLVRIQLRIEVLRSSIHRRRTLVGAVGRTTRVHLVGGLPLQVLRQMMGLVGNDTVGQLDTMTKATGKDRGQQTDIVFLQVLIEECAGYLQKQRLRVGIIRLKDEGLEPCIILLLFDVLLYQSQGAVP